MIKNVIDKTYALFSGSPLEYGVMETDIFSQVQMGENTASFIKATAGHYAEFVFAEYFNGRRSSKYGDPNDVYDSNGNGWEIKARNFRNLPNRDYPGKTNRVTSIMFCSGTAALHVKKPTRQEHIDSVKAKFEKVSGIIIVDHQYLHVNGVCRYWKIDSHQVLALFEEGLWKGKRKINGEFSYVEQYKRLKSAQSFLATMSNMFQTRHEKSFSDFELEDWLGFPSN